MQIEPRFVIKLQDVLTQTIMSPGLMHFETEFNYKFHIDIRQHHYNCTPLLNFYQPPLAHFGGPLIPLNHLWQVSQLEMRDSACVIHRPFFLVTFHLSCYIGVRYLPPAPSLCGVLMS